MITSLSAASHVAFRRGIMQKVNTPAPPFHGVLRARSQLSPGNEGGIDTAVVGRGEAPGVAHVGRRQLVSLAICILREIHCALRYKRYHEATWPHLSIGIGSAAIPRFLRSSSGARPSELLARPLCCLEQHGLFHQFRPENS